MNIKWEVRMLSSEKRDYGLEKLGPWRKGGPVCEQKENTRHSQNTKCDHLANYLHWNEKFTMECKSFALYANYNYRNYNSLSLRTRTIITLLTNIVLSFQHVFNVKIWGILHPFLLQTKSDVHFVIIANLNLD